MDATISGVFIKYIAWSSDVWSVMFIYIKSQLCVIHFRRHKAVT